MHSIIIVVNIAFPNDTNSVLKNSWKLKTSNNVNVKKIIHRALF